MTKREHVMSRALGTFEQNWTLDCVSDECNKYFADNLERPLGRDSREALFRIDLGLKSAGYHELSDPTWIGRLLLATVPSRSRHRERPDGDGARLRFVPGGARNERCV